MSTIFLILLACLAQAYAMNEDHGSGSRSTRGYNLGTSGLLDDISGGYGSSYSGNSYEAPDLGDHGSHAFGSSSGLGGSLGYGLDSGNTGGYNFGHDLGGGNLAGHSLPSLGGHKYDFGSSRIYGDKHYQPSYDEVEAEEHSSEEVVGNEGFHQFPIQGEPSIHETTKTIPVHKTLKIPVHHPVHQAFKVPVPVQVAVPYELKIPVPVTVEKTVQVPVEKVVPYPVEKPVPYKVFKKVPYPVEKPYPVPYPVYKVRYVYHTKKIHQGHYHH